MQLPASRKSTKSSSPASARASKKSLEVKRNADARLEVVTAEDVGKLRLTTWPTRCVACPA